MSTAQELGLILLAHGARDPRWAAPFEAIARHLRDGQAGLEVRLAYLDFMTPDLLEAGAQLARAGCTRITVAPLFLGAGGHVRQDVPRLLQQLGQQHPGVRWTLLPAIGEIESVTRAMAEAVVKGLQDV